MNDETMWTYEMRCENCGRECRCGTKKVEHDPEEGLSYESFRVTMEAEPPRWRYCEACRGRTKWNVVWYEACHLCGGRGRVVPKWDCDVKSVECPRCHSTNDQGQPPATGGEVSNHHQPE